MLSKSPRLGPQWWKSRQNRTVEWLLGALAGMAGVLMPRFSHALGAYTLHRRAGGPEPGRGEDSMASGSSATSSALVLEQAVAQMMFGPSAPGGGF